MIDSKKNWSGRRGNREKPGWTDPGKLWRLKNQQIQSRELTKYFFFVFVMFRDSWPWLIQKSPGVIINRVVVTVKCLENKVYDYMFLQVVLKVVLFLYFYSWQAHPSTIFVSVWIPANIKQGIKEESVQLPLLPDRCQGYLFRFRFRTLNP